MLPHPLLESLINLHASFLATFASHLNCGDWRWPPICIAASALFGCEPCCHVGIMACHTQIACEPDQHAFFIPCHLASNLKFRDWRCLPIRTATSALLRLANMLLGCCHAGIMACQHYLCHGALLLPSIACQPLVQVALWSLLCKLLLPTCTCMFACHDVACMHDRDMQHAQYIGCAVSFQ